MKTLLTRLVAGALAPASTAPLSELRRQSAATPPATPFTRWLAWFLADRATLTISAESAITVPEYHARQPEQSNVPTPRSPHPTPQAHQE